MSDAYVNLTLEKAEGIATVTINRPAAYEADLFAFSFATADQKEGMAAFLEKRPARFRDA